MGVEEKFRARAAECGKLRFIRLAVAEGTDVNTTEKRNTSPAWAADGSPALTYAVIANQEAAGALLLELGASPDTRGALGMTSLMTAVTRGNSNVASKD